MTLIATNPFLLGLQQGSDVTFNPQQILDAFDEQLARREGYHQAQEFFVPPPSLKNAEIIVGESKEAIGTVLAKHDLSADTEVDDITAREELVQVVRDHLARFAY